MFDNVETRVTDRFDDIRRLHYIRSRRQVSLEATFLGALATTSLDVQGPCSPPISDTLRLDNFSNTNNQGSSHLVGEIWGCTRHTFLGQYPVENTASNYSLSMRYVYVVPASTLIPGEGVTPTNFYYLRTTESLSGVVTLKRRRTFNSWWVDREERDFGAAVSIQREVRVFDTALPPDEPALSFNEEILSDSIRRNDQDIDELELGVGESIRLASINNHHEIDIERGFFPWIFSGVGGDLVIIITYRFAASAEGQNNIVKFAGPRRRPEILEGSGPFIIRNEGVILETEFEEPFRIGA